MAEIISTPTWPGFLYLAVVMDVYSRRIVACAMETHLRTKPILSALEMALTRRLEAIIHHSDRGCPIYELCLRQALPRGQSHAIDGLGG